MNFFEKPISAMTDEEIQSVIKIYQEEQDQRKKVQRENAINEFHNAFTKLRELNILPRYDDPDTMENYYLEDWEQFCFT